MYEDAQAKMLIASGQMRLGAVDYNPTVEENIDSRIDGLRKEIERLEQSKVDLAPLLKMRIRDVRNAMELY